MLRALYHCEFCIDNLLTYLLSFHVRHVRLSMVHRFRPFNVPGSENHVRVSGIRHQILSLPEERKRKT